MWPRNDTPTTGTNTDLAGTRQRRPSHLRPVAQDKRVLVMIFQYSACFGTELAMNNQLATHFRTYFQLKVGGVAETGQRAEPREIKQGVCRCRVHSK